MILDKFDEEGNPFGVYCSNPNCPLSEEQDRMPDPMWSEDCPVKMHMLVCPNCQSPVKSPKPYNR